MRKPRGPSRPKTTARQDDVKEGDVLPPAPEGIPPALYAEIIAQINQYTDRPDLLIEVIEKHDPGFIKAMNDEAREFSKKSRTSRFNFGRAQAYTALAIQVLAAIAVLAGLGWLVYSQKLTFGNGLAIGIIYAITQSGTSGFTKIVSQIAQLIKGRN
ncbi:hypothetical protein QTA58_22830 [Neorhizobium sp. CSC1952]|uniref:hypothetical protein n=1 Tax=Neorhizobium sp. CSC1952 TaxID=2978974 RepID=UPI0025A634A9|nr:hypothetical protein [Rhizobium sp. CSC1952]WJR66988.1 hypothetical protein QTA58_22830 [Rhizobium sp. CSC1952]